MVGTKKHLLTEEKKVLLKRKLINVNSRNVLAKDIEKSNVVL